ncbi:MAG: hypothetical protein ACT4P5_11290 [Armatimonadota bacterium]
MAERTVFSSPAEEREYLAGVKAELEHAETKADVIEVWKRHYLKIGHRKLARLLLGRPIDEIVRVKE